MVEDLIHMLSKHLGADISEKAVIRYHEGEDRYFQSDFESALLKFGKMAELLKLGLQGKYLGEKGRLGFREFSTKMFSLSTKEPEAIRRLIPRILRTIYDFRSGRGVAHEGEIDPNKVDAALSYELSSWVLAELVRNYGNTKIEEAAKIVNSLFSRRIPMVEEVEPGDFRILLPNLTMKEEILLLLYNRRGNWVTNDELRTWIRPSNPRLITNGLPKLDRDRLAFYKNRRIKISGLGIAFIEEKVWPRIKQDLFFKT